MENILISRDFMKKILDLQRICEIVAACIQIPNKTTITKTNIIRIINQQRIQTKIKFLKINYLFLQTPSINYPNNQ